MKTAIIKIATNIVENIIELKQGAIWELPVGYYKVADNRAIKDATWNGTDFIAPPLPAVDNSGLTLTVRQFFIMLANSGYITPEEAITTAQTGIIPANIVVTASLPPKQALDIQITWAKMTTVARNEPLIAVMAKSLNLTKQEMDQFFIVGQKI